MKKVNLIIIKLFLFIMFSTLGYSTPSYSDLGNPVGKIMTSYFYTGYGITTITLIPHQFGTLIKGFDGGDIIWLYGTGDLPWWTKSSNYDIENRIKIDSENDYYINILDLSDITNPNLIKQKVVKGSSRINLKNLNINLKTGKFYIIMLNDNDGNILDILKIYKD